MSYQDWKDKAKNFNVTDLRHLQENFFPALKKRAENMALGEGFKIIQTFKPHPLYPVMEKLGFEHHTEEIDKNEFHVYFYRAEKAEEGASFSPFKPLALLNFPMIDEDLGNLAMDFWKLTWDSENRTIPYDIRLLLSLTNAVGAGRMRQASRELIKAYAGGMDSAMFDDVFELLAWNQGIGFFASEIGPSTLFKVYKTIKKNEKKGKSREEIMEVIMKNFGEGNPETSVK